MLNAIFLASFVMMFLSIAGATWALFQANMREGEAEDRAYKRFTFFAGSFSASLVAAIVSSFLFYIL